MPLAAELSCWPKFHVFKYSGPQLTLFKWNSLLLIIAPFVIFVRKRKSPLKCQQLLQTRIGNQINFCVCSYKYAFPCLFLKIPWLVKYDTLYIEIPWTNNHRWFKISPSQKLSWKLPTLVTHKAQWRYLKCQAMEHQDRAGCSHPRKSNRKRQACMPLSPLWDEGQSQQHRMWEPEASSSPSGKRPL